MGTGAGAGTWLPRGKHHLAGGDFWCVEHRDRVRAAEHLQQFYQRPDFAIRKTHSGRGLRGGRRIVGRSQENQCALHGRADLRQCIGDHTQL